MLPITSLSHNDTTSPSAPFIPIRALLLDDNRFDQRRIERMARETGLMISIDIAANLGDMSDFLNLREYDIAFLDYRLPIGSGRDAIELLRNHQHNRTCATVMVAGDEQLDSCAQSMREACDTFIGKDQLSPDVLRDTVTTVLNERAFQRAEEEQPDDIEIPNWQMEIEVDIEALIRDIRHLKSMRHEKSFDLMANLSKLECRSIRIWSDIRTHAAQLTGQEAKFEVLAGHPGKPRRAH